MRLAARTVRVHVVMEYAAQLHQRRKKRGITEETATTPSEHAATSDASAPTR